MNSKYGEALYPIEQYRDEIMTVIESIMQIDKEAARAGVGTLRAEHIAELEQIMPDTLTRRRFMWLFSHMKAHRAKIEYELKLQRI